MVRDGFLSGPPLLEKGGVCKNHLCTSGDVLVPTGSLPSESFDGSFASLSEN